MADFPYRFCPSCGAPLERRALRPAEPERLACPACEFVHYLNPKVAVGTIIATGDGRLVMVRRAIQPGYGLWGIAASRSRRPRCARRSRRAV